MSIGLSEDSYQIEAGGSATRPELPPHGGGAKATFKVTMSNRRLKLEATLRCESAAYVFAGGKKTQKEVFKCRQTASNTPADYEMEMEISQKGVDEQGRIPITLKVQEVFPDGEATDDPAETDVEAIRIRRPSDSERASLAQTLVNLRTAKGKTQAEAAKFAGLSVSTISRAERGLVVSDESLATIMAKLKKLRR